METQHNSEKRVSAPDSPQSSVPSERKWLRPKLKAEQTHKPYFVTLYIKELIKQIMKTNWDIIERDHSLQQVFTEPPGVSFRRAATIRDKLVRSQRPARTPVLTDPPVCPKPLLW
ncbi:unnamed protein product [Pleuronectes platessa]|uniref:Uncharacterized protein n=1 Tax=Pleuronectes platessa TaxID=8262 RepID=A0A9N7VL57_PLEPL|nr:unnamed protein product [Pleuronectes platessa]